MNFEECYTWIKLELAWFGEALVEWSKSSIFIYPIFLSFVAALIFWIIFAYLPERQKYKKLRPIVELCLFDAYKELFFLFDIIMQHRADSPSFYQVEIRSGKLSYEQIKLGLQNKCLNASYLKCDSTIKDKLIIVGQRILDHTLMIEYYINKTDRFSQFITADEILLFEEINHELRKFDYGERQVNEPAQTIIGQYEYCDAVPVIYYRTSNFFNLYKLFCKLQLIIFNDCLTLKNNRDYILYKTQYLYYSGAYKDCLSLTESLNNLTKEDAFFCEKYGIVSQLGIGNKAKFYYLLDNWFRTRPLTMGHLVSERDFLKNFLEDDKVVSILSKHFTGDDIHYLLVEIKKEFHQKEYFETTNRELSEYFSKKDKRLKPITKH